MSSRNILPDPRGLGIAMAGALLVFAVHYGHGVFSEQAQFVHDDAYITLRYARNWVTGYGPVWNPGERVEGYTSFAALAAIALLHRSGMALEAAALWINVAGMLVLALAVGRCAWRCSPPGPARPVLAAIPLALSISHAPLWIWVHGRLETPFAVGCIAVALVLMLHLLERPADLKRTVAAALSLGLLVVVRPDGAAFGAVAAVFFAGACRRLGSEGYKRFATFALVGLAPAALQLAFRLSFYGTWLPNTVAVKAFGLPTQPWAEEGLPYLGRFLAAPSWIPAAGLALAPFALARRNLRRDAAYLLATTVFFSAMIVRVGGDHMPVHRLLLPVVPGALLLIAFGLRAVFEMASRRGRLLVASLAGSVLTALAIYQQNVYRPLPPDHAVFGGSIVGRYLDEHFPHGTLVALNTGGSTPYFAPHLRFIDMLGLNDAHIARREIEEFRLEGQRMPGHGKGDGRYVLDRSPDLIIIGPARGVPADNPWFLSDLELSELAEFGARYRMRRAAIDVRDVPGHQDFSATRLGFLPLTYYERVATPDDERNALAPTRNKASGEVR